MKRILFLITFLFCWVTSFTRQNTLVEQNEVARPGWVMEKLSVFPDSDNRNNVPVKQLLPLDSFVHFYGNLNNFLYRIQMEKRATVVFLGGSITNMKGWRDMISQYLQILYPDVLFTFINAGIPSLGSVPHAFRLQNDVLNKGRVDLMFIESAVNDHGNGTTELQQKRSLEGIVRHAKAANPYMDMVMMAFADEDKIADYKMGNIPVEVKVHEDIAEHYHLPFINLAEEVSKRIATGEFTWASDFKNLHPSPFGQEIYFQAIKWMFQNTLSGKVADSLSTGETPFPLQKGNYSHGLYVPVKNFNKKTGFEYQTSWHPVDSAGTRPGFVNVPMLVAGKPNASLDFLFKGTTVGIVVIAGPDAGIIKYTIDDTKERTVDLFTKWSKSLHLPWYVILGDDLKNQTHTLHIAISGEHNLKSKGTSCRIVYFIVNE